MITLEDWALIRRLYVSERLPQAQIARQLGISRNTVAKAIASTDPPSYSRTPIPTSFTPFEQQVRDLLDATWSMPATVLAERVGWSGSASWFRQNVAAIRPVNRPGSGGGSDSTKGWTHASTEEVSAGVAGPGATACR